MKRLVLILLTVCLTAATARASFMGQFSGALASYRAPQAPNAPTGVTATPGYLKNTLSWTASAVDSGHDAATQYNLLRGASSGAESLVASNITSPYVDTGRTTGVTDYYKIQAQNAVGTANSSEVSATPNANWWLAGSITAPSVVYAYNAKSSSYANSKVNLSSPGTYNATDGAAAPSWDSTNGWTFNGSSQYLGVSASSALSSLTIVVRCNLPDTTAAYAMVGSSANGNPALRSNTNGTLTLTKFNVEDVGSSTGTVTTGSSHVYAVTYTGSTYTFYKDGAQIGTGTKTLSWGTSATDKIGVTYDGGGAYSWWLKGSIQAVAKYNTALSAADIATLSTAMAGL